MNVADGEGEHAAEWHLDAGALQVKLREEIVNAPYDQEALDQLSKLTKVHNDE